MVPSFLVGVITDTLGSDDGLFKVFRIPDLEEPSIGSWAFTELTS